MENTQILCSPRRVFHVENSRLSQNISIEYSEPELWTCFLIGLGWNNLSQLFLVITPAVRSPRSHSENNKVRLAVSS